MSGQVYLKILQGNMKPGVKFLQLSYNVTWYVNVQFQFVSHTVTISMSHNVSPSPKMYTSNKVAMASNQVQLTSKEMHNFLTIDTAKTQVERNRSH